MTDKLTDLEFAQKCDWEGVEYALTDYGLSANRLHPDSTLRPLVERVDELKRPWADAVRALERALHKILEEADGDE